jgi:aryl-alcohol dehydrogenase-like predicted oxidoreductase
MGTTTAKGVWGVVLLYMVAASARSDVHVPRVELSNGVTMPLIAAGTWQYNPADAETSVLAALSVGFDHIDTAYNYRNQVTHA